MIYQTFLLCGDLLCQRVYRISTYVKMTHTSILTVMLPFLYNTEVVMLIVKLPCLQ